METTSTDAPVIANPALQPFGILVGEWKTLGRHPHLPNTMLHGHCSFQWIEEGAFLVWRSTNDEGKIPSGIAIFGSDDFTGKYFMLYFDERKVSRKYDVSAQANIIKWWRDAPGFSQRYSWTIADDGNTIIGKGELSTDGTSWEPDLDLTFSRVR